MTGASGFDWGTAAPQTLWWIAKAFVIASVALLVVVAVLVRTTVWGRQFRRIGGGFFVGRQSWPAWLMVAANMLWIVWTVRMSVLFTYQTNDLYSALQFVVQALADHKPDILHQSIHQFWFSVQVFVVLATVWVFLGLVGIWVNQAFIIRWWQWLNVRVTEDWLAGKAYYRNRFIDSTIDNPDQRIQQDVQDFVNGSFAMAFGGNVGNYSVSANGAVGSGLTVVSFVPVLWSLSRPLTLFGLTIPRGLTFVTFAYLVLGSAVAFWVGHPLIRLNFRLQRRTADFRFALVRLRESAESVALYHGERLERDNLFFRFGALIRVYWRWVYRTIGFDGVNLGLSQIDTLFPLVILAPFVFNGTMTLGQIQQAASAFTSMEAGASMPRNSYDAFTYYRSTLVRLDGMTTANVQSRELPTVETAELADGVRLDAVVVTKPDSTPLITDLTLRLELGDALVVKGDSGVGKTTLLRSIAGLWPYVQGRVERPTGDRTLFVSQLPYLPLGDLRTALAYPGDPGVFGDAALQEVLHKVALEHLADRLSEATDWSKILSPGEQQRVAFARILLLRPTVVFLDEATSAVDEGLEFALYRLVRTECPQTVLISVAHRSTVDTHHTRLLELTGGGGWRVDPRGATT
jgi:putative ATP-binding cassette transporter